MKLCIVAVAVLLCVSLSSAEEVTEFLASLNSLTEDGSILSFGQDSYRIEPRDRELAKEWEKGDVCRIKESSPRPTSYARILNYSTNNYVRGSRIKNEEDLVREKQQKKAPVCVSVRINERGHAVVPVRFGNGGHRYGFVLDTGATLTQISPALLAEISRETDPEFVGDGFAKLADGTTHRVMIYRIKNAFLFDFPLGEIEAFIFEKNMPKVKYLLGTKSLANIVISIDAGQKKVEICRKSGR